ncbi:MAG: endonuclease [Burkholderiaceae bacterium]|nr:MAG: endonuclease [Burkholderiaceae bacterium]
MAKRMGLKAAPAKNSSRYAQIIAKVFETHYRPNAEAVPFDRSEFAEIATALHIELPKNLGDAIYSFKYRVPLPVSITDTAPSGKVWALANAGRGKYEFRLVCPPDLTPKVGLSSIMVPDATPEIVGAYALGDEQALLARVRYNRLVDVFLGIVAWSLQNHLRTTVEGIGQIEVDELYVGVDKTGRQFVVPVEAKGGTDKASWQQTAQDIACCAQKFPNLICRAVTAQFVSSNKIAMFELTANNGNIVIVGERHYELARATEITEETLLQYKRTASSDSD